MQFRALVQLAAALLAGASSLNAQDKPSSVTGVLFGFSSSTVSNLDTPIGNSTQPYHTERLWSRQYGVYARFYLTNHVSIEPGVMFVRKGGTNVESTVAQVGASPQSAALILDYLEASVLLRANLPAHIGRFTPFINAGPAIGYQKGCQYRKKIGATNAYGPCRTQDAQGRLHEVAYGSWDFSGVVGAGLTGFIRKTAWVLQARYTQGFENLAPDAPTPQRNSGLALLLGIELF